jgi:hypothetical protein
VDICGGVGTITSVLEKAILGLKYVIQDLLAVIEDGIKVRLLAGDGLNSLMTSNDVQIWQEKNSKCVYNGQVRFQGMREMSDFFSFHRPSSLFSIS